MVHVEFLGDWLVDTRASVHQKTVWWTTLIENLTMQGPVHILQGSTSAGEALGCPPLRKCTVTETPVEATAVPH
jgi:hypothetical protein